ncbi:MAG: endolytic transglycosylase MltG [Polyangiaceae bacterium]
MAWLLVVALLALMLGSGVLWWWSRHGLTPRGKPQAFEVVQTEDRAALSRALAEQGLIDRPRLFALYLELFWRRSTIEPGPHLLSPGMSPALLAACLVRAPRQQVKVTIPEGQNQFQIARRLEEAGVSLASAFLAASRSAPLLAALGVRAKTAEGYLFPATYDLNLDAVPELILKNFVREGQRRYQALAARHSAAVQRLRDTLSWGPHEVITLASIVEKESGVASERGLVAGVFYNRLRDATFRPLRMLQSDPTAAYGCLLPETVAASCGAYKGTVTPDMLRDPDNPYNTYKHAGLPPGPIGNPGEATLEAVLDPPDTAYLFFVAAKDGRGHVFSRTWAEHQAAVDDLSSDQNVRRARPSP